MMGHLCASTDKRLTARRFRSTLQTFERVTCLLDLIMGEVHSGRDARFRVPRYIFKEMKNG
jgi:hypothetical protein